MSSSAAEDPLERAHSEVDRGREADERGDGDEARAAFERALEGFGRVEGDDGRLAAARFGRAEALRALGDLAEKAGERETARERHVEALELLADLMPRDPDLIRPRVAHSFLQIARMDALADRPEAEHTFRIALQVADAPADGPLRSILWHYLGAYCERRQLAIAAFLAHQQSLEELPEDAPTSELLSKLRDQLRALQDLQEIVPALAIVRLLERQGALVDDSATVVSTEQIIGQMGLPNDEAATLSALLDKPANIVAVRDDTIERMRAAVPDFASRFLAEKLDLEETRTAVLPPSAGA
jgi:tetratricopeptide (TPR) repeat protein